MQRIREWSTLIWLLAAAATTATLVGRVDVAITPPRREPVIAETCSALGRLQRPNGIAIAGDVVFVVERDNARLQVFRLPDGASMGTFAAGTLVKPYGIA